MEKKFKVLRFIGTLWKILAWIVLIGGVLFSIGILLAGVVGGGIDMRQFGQQPGMMPFALGAVSGIAGALASLFFTAVYFLTLYAIGDLIYLMLAIEENTRLTVQWMRYQASPNVQPQQVASSTPSPSPPAPPSQ